MQQPTEDDEDEASISMENETEDPNLNRIFAVRRKAAKRTLPWDLAADDLDLVPSSSPQAEDIPTARKTPRLEEPLPTTTDEAARETASPDVSVGLPPPPNADNDDTNTNADLVTVTQTNAGASTRASPRLWTLEEDAKLNSAVTNTSKKKWGKEYKTNWDAVAVLVPSRTKSQCRERWHRVLDSNVDPTTARAGKWTADEDSKLKDAVQTHSGKNWGAIAALVPGRTKVQCRDRWHQVLDPNIDGANERTGKWTEKEDIKLKNAVQTYGGKNWGAIAALVPGRMRGKCYYRWHHDLDPSIDQTNDRTVFGRKTKRRS
jgi:hypothetical protein